MRYNETTIDEVWEKARVMPNTDPTLWRKDECGAWIRRDHYGSAHSEYAWQIYNVSPGGSDALKNLRPLHRDNGFNRAAGKAVCHVSADPTGVGNQQG